MKPEKGEIWCRFSLEPDFNHSVIDRFVIAAPAFRKEIIISTGRTYFSRVEVQELLKNGIALLEEAEYLSTIMKTIASIW